MSDFTPDSLKLTLDELEEIEDLVGVPASQWENASQGKMLKAMLFIVKRRDNPKLKMADVGKLHVDDLEAELSPFGSDGSEAA